jgi:hypothetical protein
MVRPVELVVARGTSQALFLAAVTFVPQSTFLGSPRGFGFATFFGFSSCLADQLAQPITRFLAIAFLGAVLSRFDDQDALLGHLISGQAF